MLQIDRMEIDDVGGNPTRLAAAVIKQFTNLTGRVPVREVAQALGIYEIREESLVGLEGALVTFDDKDGGFILVHSERSETRKRYTIAHELGHYVNPWHKATSPQGFRCRARDMSVERYKRNDRAAKMEVEANEFAAELLMPPGLVATFLRRRAGADLEHILAMAEHFEVSKEAAARRYVVKVDEPSAVVFSKDRAIRYIKPHDDFPRLCVWNGDQLPAGCLSVDCSAPAGLVSDWAEVDGHAWLENPGERAICEQTLAQQNGYRMTLLTLDDYSDEEDDAWEPPHFRR